MKKLQLAMMMSALVFSSNASLFAQATLEPSMYSGLTLQVGQVHSGELLTSHPQMSDGSHADCFQLDTEAGKEYSVTLRSTDFDSYLMLGIGSCADVMLSLENDDFEEETLDARIVFTAEHQQYSIFVNSYDAGFTGAFTLHID
ncbi:MAG: hypothetical protein Q7W55_08305 [Pseudohongiella sp.]|nr:hypothetical protein [Pseudohongiella sp.]MDO9519869.1 hypothetical protein [Pseudohongiella sp.]MDP2126666.1 hypothetical protein [Pseudohongiella sp.]